MPVRALGHVALTLAFQREGNKWVGTCMELGTSTFARSLKRCQEELWDLVFEHLNLLEQSGERESFFQKWGIEIQPAGVRQQNEFVIRGLADSWIHTLRNRSAMEHGPFFQPGLFPLPARPSPDRALAEV